MPGRYLKPGEKPKVDHPVYVKLRNAGQPLSDEESWERFVNSLKTNTLEGKIIAWLWAHRWYGFYSIGIYGVARMAKTIVDLYQSWKEASSAQDRAITEKKLRTLNNRLGSGIDLLDITRRLKQLELKQKRHSRARRSRSRRSRRRSRT